MDRNIYIFGTDHRYQREDDSLPKDYISFFKDEVEISCRRLCIRTLAEENNLAAQGENGLNHSLLYFLSNSMNIQHIYCDPNHTERAGLGILQESDIRASHLSNQVSEKEIQDKVQNSFEKRERYWLKKIQEVNEWPVMLVCGANHVTSILSQAKKQGCIPEVVHGDWHA